MATLDKIQLSLDVEIEDGVESILNNPSKENSALFDVIVVKPKEFEALGTHVTSTLTAESVRKLIHSLEGQKTSANPELRTHLPNFAKYDTKIEREPVQKAKNNLQQHKEVFSVSAKASKCTHGSPDEFATISSSVRPLIGQIKTSLKTVERKINSIQDINLVFSQNKGQPKTVDCLSNNDFLTQNKQRALESLKSVLKCKNKQKWNVIGENDEHKCLCENCSIINFLSTYQHNANSRANYKPSPTIVYTNFENVTETGEYKINQYMYYIEQLTNKVNMLEERIAKQEEKSCPKDNIFQFFTKLFTKVIPKNFTSSPSKIQTTVKSTPQCTCQNCVHRSTIPDQNANDKATLTDNTPSGKSFWNWSMNNVVRPSINFKNKVVGLFGTMFTRIYSVRRTVNEYDSDEKNSYHRGSCHDIFGKRTVNKGNVFVTQIANNKIILTLEHQTRHCEDCPEYNSANSGIFLAVNTTEQQQILNFSDSVVSTQSIQDSSKKINVSYMNPNMISSPESGSHIYLCQCGTVTTNDSIGKKEFLNLLARTKSAERVSLWKEICKETKVNRDSSNKIVTVQIPSKDEEKVLYTVQYTVDEMKKMLTDHSHFAT